MYLSVVVKFFGGKKIKIANELDVTSGYVSQWGEIIPEAMATKLALLTNGKLKYDPGLYSKNSKKSKHVQRIKL